jgi:hypothetical protein
MISTTGTTLPTEVYPEGTLRNFAQQEGWSVSYDPNTKMVGVTNPTTQKTISFGTNMLFITVVKNLIRLVR